MFCKQCGRELIPGKRFCGGCGAPVEQMPQQRPPAPVQKAPVQKAPVQNPSTSAQQEKKDNKTKKIVAIILAVVIVLISCTVGFVVISNKKNDEKEKEELRKAVEEYTTKQLLDFYYDDYNADGKNEAFAIAGDGDKDEFKKADIIYVDRQKKPKTVDSDIDGHANGIIKDNNTKFVSVEKESEKAEDNRSFIYGVKEKDTYQPEISGEYRNVHQENNGISAEDPATGKTFVLSVNKDGELVTGKGDESSSGKEATAKKRALSPESAVKIYLENESVWKPADEGLGEYYIYFYFLDLDFDGLLEMVVHEDYGGNGGMSGNSFYRIDLNSNSVVTIPMSINSSVDSFSKLLKSSSTNELFYFGEDYTRAGAGYRWMAYTETRMINNRIISYIPLGAGVENDVETYSYYENVPKELKEKFIDINSDYEIIEKYRNELSKYEKKVDKNTFESFETQYFNNNKDCHMTGESLYLSDYIKLSDDEKLAKMTETYRSFSYDGFSYDNYELYDLDNSGKKSSQ